MTRGVTITADLEPDQQPRRWDDHVALYEEVFEPLTQRFSAAAIDVLAPRPRSHVLDSGAGAGGAALELARRGHRVTAIDASMAMVARIRQRASAAGLPVEALPMDGQDLAFSDASFDAALSVLGSLPARPLPAQLRFRERNDFQALFAAAGLPPAEISEVTAELVAPSPAWLAERLAFAPGMAALLEGFGAAEPEVLAAFRSRLEAMHGAERLALSGCAWLGSVTVAAT